MRRSGNTTALRWGAQVIAGSRRCATDEQNPARGGSAPSPDRPLAHPAARPQTPQRLYSTAMAELGRWLTYEALRDWIPQRNTRSQTPLAATEGTVVDGSVPILAIPLLRSGLALWEGARPVVPAAPWPTWPQPRRAGSTSCPLRFPSRRRAGVRAADGERSTPAAAARTTRAAGREGERLRVITALVATPGPEEPRRAFRRPHDLHRLHRSPS